MGANIGAKSEKCWKKGMLKTMPTFDAEKNSYFLKKKRICSILD